MGKLTIGQVTLDRVSRKSAGILRQLPAGHLQQVLAATSGHSGSQYDVAAVVTPSELIIATDPLIQVPVTQIAALQKGGAIDLRSGESVHFSPYTVTDRDLFVGALVRASGVSAPGRPSPEELFWSSPVGEARTARSRGQGFFEIQLDVGESVRDVSFGSADHAVSDTRTSHPDLLSAIESEGWTLHTASYVFIPTGESTRDKILGTGQSVAISGRTVGIYLFRAAPS